MQAMGTPTASYVRRKPEQTLIYKLVRRHWPELQHELLAANDGQPLPKFLTNAVEGYGRCGILKYGFCRLFCPDCKTDQLVAWSCKQRGICASCDGKRMTELAAHLADSVIAEVPVRQWVLTVPMGLHELLAWNVDVRGAVLAAFMRALQAHYRRMGLAQGQLDPKFAAVSVLQRFSGSLKIYPHWHILAADGAWQQADDGKMAFKPAPPLDEEQLHNVLTDAVARIRRQLDKHNKRRDDADARDTFGESQPALAALIRSSLGGKEIREQDPPPKPGQAKTAPRTESKNCMSFAGFSLHANTRVHECNREKLERLIRYVCRPTIAAERLEDAGGGAVRILLKNEWKGRIKSIVISEREFVVGKAKLLRCRARRFIAPSIRARRTCRCPRLARWRCTAGRKRPRPRHAKRRRRTTTRRS